MDMYEEIHHMAGEAINPTLTQAQRDEALESLNGIKELVENLQERIALGDMYLLSDLFWDEWVEVLE
jgi:copper homeostasis protein CutC